MNRQSLRASLVWRSFWSLIMLASTCLYALAQRGRVESGRMTSEALAQGLYGDNPSRPFKVYLPASYDVTTNHLPVIYVLHGYTQDENALVGAVQSSLDSLIRQGTVSAMLAVFVNGANRLKGSFYLSSAAIGDYETYITEELVGLIDTHYRTLTSRESRGITGFSMGGWGAMHLALKYPNLFSAVVAESGLYDARGKLLDGLARQFVTLHPTNLAQFDAVAFPINSVQALCAGLSPNLERPPLFADYPYIRQDGQLVLDEKIHQRCLEGDVQHGDLQRYIQQPTRLNGIRIVHGTADPLVPIAEARQFTNALTAAGLNFEYQEHPGGHEYRAELALSFLSAHLRTNEAEVQAPRLMITRVTNQVQLSFSAQIETGYRLESSPALGAEAVWDEVARIAGDGLVWRRAFSLETRGHFFRIRPVDLAP
ncbi:MAG: alpha/beta hydrolase-fold protein [Verrucomicrobiota bacterium]